MKLESGNFTGLAGFTLKCLYMMETNDDVGACHCLSEHVITKDIHWSLSAYLVLPQNNWLIVISAVMQNPLVYGGGSKQKTSDIWQMC